MKQIILHVEKHEEFIMVINLEVISHCGFTDLSETSIQIPRWYISSREDSTNETNYPSCGKA